MKKLSRAIFILTLVFACIICVHTAGAATYFIKQNGNGDGSSWANTSGDLKNVLDNASAGDVIYVASGDYSPGTNSDTFNLKKGVKLYSNLRFYVSTQLTDQPRASHGWRAFAGAS